MASAINFIFTNIALPLALSVLYSCSPEKYGLQCNITKAVWYLFYAAAVSYDYLVRSSQQYVAGFAVTIAIMEGIPLILVPLLSLGKSKEKGSKK